MHKYLVTLKSSNPITGPILVTTSPRQTCPSACALKDTDCYAGRGFLGHYLWTALDRSKPGDQKMHQDVCRIATGPQQETSSGKHQSEGKRRDTRRTGCSRQNRTGHRDRSVHKQRTLQAIARVRTKHLVPLWIKQDRRFICEIHRRP